MWQEETRELARRESRSAVILSPAQVGERITVAPKTLANWRCEFDKGPKFFHIGTLVRYYETEVDAWVAEQAGALK